MKSNKKQPEEIDQLKLEMEKLIESAFRLFWMNQKSFLLIKILHCPVYSLKIAVGPTTLASNSEALKEL